LKTVGVADSRPARGALAWRNARGRAGFAPEQSERGPPGHTGRGQPLNHSL